VRTVRYDPGDFPPLSPGSTLAGALAQALRQGRPLLPAIDREGRVIGVFDLPGFLARLSPRGRSDLDAPVGPLLEKAPVLVSPGLEDSWARDGASESAVVVDEAGRYRGILFRDEGPTPPSAHDRVDAWLRQLSEGVLAGVSYMVAVADTAGRVVLANAELRRFFGEALAGDEPVLHRLFPPRALGSAGALGGWQAPRIHQHRGRLLLVFGFPLVVEGALRYVTLAIHDVSALVGEQLAQAHEDLDGLRRVLDVMVDGLMVVNRDGVITMINPSFEEIHGVPSERVIGRHVTDVIENTRMHIVAQTGIAEHGELQKIGERRVVVSRIPLYRDGRCVGAAGKIDFTDLGEVNRLAHKVEHLKKELEALRSRKGTVAPDVRFGFADIPALSPASRGAKESAMRAAPQNSTVLLLGESGVGKEVFAHSIHAYSTRAPRPFVRVNCSAIQETLFESELFGYEDGAFTGARKGGKQGKFEMADGGTIFLDEIGELPLAVQAKLLRVLQEQEIEKVGSEQVLKVDVSRRRHEPGPREAGRRRTLSQGPLLPPLGHPDPDPAASGTARGHPRADPRLLGGPEEAARHLPQGALPGSAEAAGSLRVAGEHPRAAQRPRAGADDRRRADDQRRAGPDDHGGRPGEPGGLLPLGGLRARRSRRADGAPRPRLRPGADEQQQAPGGEAPEDLPRAPLQEAARVRDRVSPGTAGAGRK
jgi:PAS domain S-box-containing protein